MNSLQIIDKLLWKKLANLRPHTTVLRQTNAMRLYEEELQMEFGNLYIFVHFLFPISVVNWVIITFSLWLKVGHDLVIIELKEHAGKLR